MDRVFQFAPYVGMEEYEALKSCFELNWFTEGPKSKEFLQKLKDLMGVKHASFAPNGTLALYLGLKAMGVGRGDEVIVPDYTFVASGMAVEMVGAVPVFCDINPDSCQVEAQHIEPKITSKTKAIMPVHIYGMTCDMDPILDLAKKHNLKVIEDAAQAVGVHYKGSHSGSMGDVGCFSFFADKTITTGEGGLVITNNDEIGENLLYLRNVGRVDRGSFIHPRLGYNFRMTDLQTAIGLVQLAKLDEIKDKKLTLMARYREQLADIPQIRFIEVTEGSGYIPFRVAVYAERAEELMKFMDENNIEVRTFFYPLHKQPAFEYLKNDPEYGSLMDDSHFPGAIYAYENGICLPSYPALPLEQLDYICEKFHEFYK